VTHLDLQCDLQEDGPQDCGRFLLEVLGPYRRDQLHAQWSSQARPTIEHVERFIEGSWLKRSQQAAAEGVALWDGKLCRLIEFSHDASTLDMLLGPTSFREFVGTNLHNAHLRYAHGPDVMANPVGVSALVQVKRYLILERRSQKVAYHAGRLHPVGGCLEGPADGTAPDPFDCVARETCEELGLAMENLQEPLCLGMVRDKHIHQPELIFELAVGSSVEAIRRHSVKAQSRYEHDELVVLADHPASVVDFIERKFAELTPVALASLLLHGLYRWGSGWFTSTRGYLRGVV
jgi:hypothetical protein